MLNSTDVYGRYTEEGKKIKRYEESDLDKIQQALRILRGRMLGMSWRDLAKLEGTTVSTLFDRSKNILSDLITQYRFDSDDGLPEDYKSFYGHDLNNTKKDLLDRVGDGRLLTTQQYDETVDEVLIDEMITAWEHVTKLSWRKTLEIGFDELYEKHGDLFDKWDSYEKRHKRFSNCSVGICDLIEDYEVKKNDHLHPGHGSWKQRVSH